jgi:hypothetical protein
MLLIDFSASGYLRAAGKPRDLCKPRIFGKDRYDPRLPKPAAAPAPGDRCGRAAGRLRAAGLDTVPDTFVLYRMLGNDLPPRHEIGQTLANLRFMLDHEPELEACEKRWVVNRIVDPEQEAAIIALLEERGQSYLRIPFELANTAASAGTSQFPRRRVLPARTLREDERL